LKLYFHLLSLFRSGDAVLLWLVMTVEIIDVVSPIGTLHDRIQLDNRQIVLASLNLAAISLFCTSGRLE